jgi:hypothetical protein
MLGGVLYMIIMFHSDFINIPPEIIIRIVDIAPDQTY